DFIMFLEGLREIIFAYDPMLPIYPGQTIEKPAEEKLAWYLWPLIDRDAPSRLKNREISTIMRVPVDELSYLKEYYAERGPLEAQYPEYMPETAFNIFHLRWHVLQRAALPKIALARSAPQIYLWSHDQMGQNLPSEALET